MPEPENRVSEPVDDLRIVNEFALSMLQQNTLEDLLWSIARNAGTQLGFEDCVVYLREGDDLVQAAAYGVKNPRDREIKDAIVIPIGHGIVGSAAANAAPRRVFDTTREPDYIADQFDGRSELAVPIRFAGEVIGVIDSESSRIGRYTQADEELLQWIANIAACRIASAIAERERETADDALRRARETQLDSLGLLAGSIAHQFNNLLLVIRGNLSLVRHSCPDSSDLRPPLDAAWRACARADELPKQLLALASGGAPAIVHGRALEPLIADTVQRTLHGSPVTHELDLPSSLPAVDIDEGQIRQVIEHIVTNAKQAMADGGHLQVSGHMSHDSSRGEHVRITFADDGPGIDAAASTRIFEPYFSTSPGRLGLGLTVAKRIMVRHGGDLIAEPAPPPGARFTLIFLPTEAKRPRDAAADPDMTTPDRSPLNILVVDDQPPIRELLERMLQRVGHDVTSAPDGESAIRIAEESERSGRPFDLYFLDLTMPGGMGGVTVLERLRKSVTSAHAIVMSGYSKDPVIANFRDYGFRGRLQKPFGLEELESAIEQTRRAIDDVDRQSERA